MADPMIDKSNYVTRQEFNVALSLIWLYIALVLGKLDLDSGSVTTIILFCAAMLMSVTFSVIAIKAMKQGKSGVSRRNVP